MPLDDARDEDVRGWMERARTDLDAGAHDLAADPPFLGDAAFHAQQAVEKVLKAYLAWHDTPFRKTHNLTELGGQCVELEASLEPLLARSSPLTEYAWKFRYPGDPFSPSPEEVENALDLAETIYEAVLTRLPDGIEPEPR